MSLEQNPSQRTENPDIASTVHDLKAIHAQPEVIPPEANKDKTHRMGHLPIMVGGTVLAAAVAVGGAFGIGKAVGGGESKPSPESKPTASAPAVPGESEAAEPTLEFGIPAAEINNDLETFAQEYNSQLNQYLISGATEEAATANVRFSMDDHAYVAELSAPIDEAFITNMFVDDWENNPDLVNYIDSIKYIASTTRLARILTYSGGTEDIEPYVRETLIDNIVLDPNDPNKVSVRWHEQDNRNMNTAEDILDGTDPNTQTGGETYTTVVENGQVKISDISKYNG